MKNDAVFLNHMLQRCERIQSTLQGHTKEEFLDDEDMQDIIIRSLEVIGEATVHISDELKKQHPEIPWADVKNFRNQMIHQYFRVDLQIVFDVITYDIPELQNQLTVLLNE